MDLLQSENVARATAIFLRLYKYGEIKAQDAPELFKEYQYNQEVRWILDNVICKEGDFHIFEGDDILYLTPGIDNIWMGYTNEELRKEIGSLSNNTELQLIYWIYLSIISVFYGRGSGERLRSYIRVEELEGYITQKVELFSGEDKEITNFDMKRIGKAWMGLAPYDETIKRTAASKNTRLAYIHKGSGFLAREGLIQFIDEREIRPTEKLDRMVRFYSFAGKKDMLLNTLKALEEEKNAQNKQD